MTAGKSDEEIIAEYDKLIAEGKELEGLVPVEARVARNRRSVFSIRLTPAELTEITLAARERRMTISDFMRQAALAAVRDAASLDAGKQATALHAVREKARELYDAVNEL